MAKIFLTGASGFIGGSVLQHLVKLHPEYSITVLNRDVSKAGAITKAFPNVRITQGSLDDEEILMREADAADVVLNLAATGHLNATQTLHKALASRSNSDKSPCLIQVSGATALAAAEIADKSRQPGTGSEAVFDDLDGASSIRSIINAHATSRVVDHYILNASAPNVHTALVFPPVVYGRGTGPVHTVSVQVPALVRATLSRKRGVRVGPGLSRWGNVHVDSLSALFVRLTEEAVKGNDDERLWGQNGLYLTGVGEMTFGELSRQVAAAAAEQGLIPNDEVDEVNGDEANVLLPHGTILFGTNARSKARRAQKILGWSPKGPSLEDTIPDTVAIEAQAFKPC
ncbi:NAD(P)-binding protein [Hypoxylon sp. FL0890]|nr:NAD(P)-binding protein [Hypoxylon sp. FL0890]